MHYAHSTDNPDRSDWQALTDHLHAVAQRAAVFAAKFGAPKAAALAGWLHDLGKYADAFQAYIQGRGPSPDHSTAGACEAMRLAASGMDRLIAELVAYCVAGHHAGLPDRTGIGGSLDERIGKKIPPLDPLWRTQVPLDPIGLWPASFAFHPSDQTRHFFQLAFLGRMLFSCLIDADRLDTEAFAARIEGRAIDREWPSLRNEADRLIAAFDAYMDAKLAALPQEICDSNVNRLRRDILAHVRNKAGLPKGVFTLDVPTGGGKTLASLIFALEHARRWGMQRIVYAIPFTSVIDQTAQIFRDVLGREMILEHHSSIDAKDARQEERDSPGDQRLDRKLRLAMENWAAPIVVTTNVQLFESLFSHRPSRCRQLHNLANAVIILDEVQTLPLHVLRPCVAALDELARNYGCTIVLCTATQPALMAPRFKGGFEIGADRELAPDPTTLHEALRRVTLRQAGVMTDEMLIAELAQASQGLLIVNSRGMRAPSTARP